MHLNPETRQRGVGLIEILVALVVLSIGFLTAANMQLQGIRFNQESFYRSQALLLLNDMMDRMRGNPLGVQAGAYDNKRTSDASTPGCLTTGCTPAQRAQLDLFQWSASLQSLQGETNFVPVLPPKADGTPAQGSISNPAGGIYTIALSWDELVDGTVETQTLDAKFVP